MKPRSKHDKMPAYSAEKADEGSRAQVSERLLKELFSLALKMACIELDFTRTWDFSEAE